MACHVLLRAQQQQSVFQDRRCLKRRLKSLKSVIQTSNFIHHIHKNIERTPFSITISTAHEHPASTNLGATVIAPTLLLTPAKGQSTDIVHDRSHAALALCHLRGRDRVRCGNVERCVLREEVSRAQEDCHRLCGHYCGVCQLRYRGKDAERGNEPGKSSGVGKCVTPKVCQSTTSVLSRLPCGSAEIHSGMPFDGSPEVCGTWRPAG